MFYDTTAKEAKQYNVRYESFEIYSTIYIEDKRLNFRQKREWSQGEKKSLKRLRSYIVKLSARQREVKG